MDFNDRPGLVERCWSLLVSTRIPKSDVMGVSEIKSYVSIINQLVGVNKSTFDPKGTW